MKGKQIFDFYANGPFKMSGDMRDAMKRWIQVTAPQVNINAVYQVSLTKVDGKPVSATFHLWALTPDGKKIFDPSVNVPPASSCR